MKLHFLDNQKEKLKHLKACGETYSLGTCPRVRDRSVNPLMRHEEKIAAPSSRRSKSGRTDLPFSLVGTLKIYLKITPIHTLCQQPSFLVENHHKP